MKKVIVKVDVHDDRMKQKCWKAVRGLKGKKTGSMDMKDHKLTVIGDIDPVDLVRKLRKLCSTEVLSVGPSEEEKKEEPKKEEPKNDKKEKEPLKDEPKKDDIKEKEKEMAELIKAYQAYNPYMTQHDFVRSVEEEDPNACAIC